MNKGINRCMFFGEISGDAFFHMVGGLELVHFKLEVGDYYKAGREWKLQSEVIPCSWSGPRAKRMRPLLKAGRAVFVEGKFHTRKTEKGSSVEIRVSDVSMTDGSDGPAPGIEKAPYDT